MIAAKKDKITGDSLGTGRRKTSVARVRIRPGTGVIMINDRPMEEYFPSEQDRRQVLSTLHQVEQGNKIDVSARVNGGGLTGQSGAVKMGLARALIGMDESFFGPLRDGGYLTRDSRMKERKKYGLRGARRGTQFSKR
jgi:small subunit ribosomal protein S9